MGERGVSGALSPKPNQVARLKTQLARAKHDHLCPKRWGFDMPSISRNVCNTKYYLNV